MRAVVQRVDRAEVRVAGEIVGSIGRGLLVLLGAGAGDTEGDADWMAHKVLGLRIFEDEDGKMNRSVVEEQGAILVVSQFTLYGDCRRGMRPSFTGAMDPAQAERLLQIFVRKVSTVLGKVEQGRFGAMMDVESINQGPVTILLDSARKF